MKNEKPAQTPPPDAHGNPAYPSFEEREAMIRDSINEDAKVRKIPADDLKKYAEKKQAEGH